LQGSERLVSAIQALSLARDLPAVCDIVRRAARELTGADGATFVLRDQDRCYYVDEDTIAPLWKGKTFSMSACISGWVMTHRQPVVVPDIYADPRIPHEAYRPTFVKSMAMVPIRTFAPIGAIGNYWADTHAATDKELRLLQALADSASVALENIQVHNELEERVRERTMQLQAANEELEAFSYSVSHDLRAPLSSIIGFAQLMEADPAVRSQPKLHQYATRISQAADRMSDLIDNLLKLAHVSRMELNSEAVDLSAIAREAIQALHGPSVTHAVRFKVAPSMRAVGDRSLLRIVLDNLLSNAWKYSSTQPISSIEIGVEPGEHPVYYVKDNGVGFDMKHADRLFTPFERLHTQSQFPGTGVGLTIVQRIIHKHGGEIWAESDVGKGATFFFTLGPRPDSNVALLKEVIGY
jgi:signal transduction histidine kinase